MDKYLQKGAPKKRKADSADSNSSTANVTKEQSTSVSKLPDDISHSRGDNLSRPILKDYPKHKEGNSHPRSFVSGWYDKYEWAEYSRNKDAMYCYCCRHFSLPGFESTEEVWTKTGFRRWKKAHGKDGAIKKHNNSRCHINAMVAWEDYKLNMERGTSIRQDLSEMYRKKVKENRHYIKTIGEIILLTATQNIAQRGHREGDDVVNPGNVRKFLRLIAKHDPIVGDRLSSGPKNEKYTSVAIQNEIIDTFASMVLEEITENVKTCNYFSIQADESKDVRKTEQLSIVIRFFNESTMKIEECFVTFIAMMELDAESMCNAILSQLEKMGLDYRSSLVGMGFDGASVMSGKCSGVQAHIREVAPLAYYVHCYGHRLNLVLVDTINGVPQAADFFSLLEQLYVFISNSVVHGKFVNVQKEKHYGGKILELPNLSATRWWARATSCKNLLLRFDCVMDILRDVSENDKGGRAVAARGLLSQLTPEFLHMLYFFENILSKVNKVSEQIQDPSIDLGAACKLVIALRDELLRLRSDPKSYEEDVKDLCSNCDIEQIEPSRNRRAPKNLDDYVTLDPVGKSRESNPEIDSYLNLYTQLLDKLVMELNKRFSTDSQHIMRGISALTPTSKEFLNYDSLTELAIRFDISPDELNHEIPLVKKILKDAKTVTEFLVELCPYKKAFDCIYRLLLISVTLPVASASCERSFSKMKIVKSYLRNSMSNDRLSNLALLSIESERAEQIDMDDFVDEFDSRHENRRIKLH